MGFDHPPHLEAIHHQLLRPRQRGAQRLTPRRHTHLHRGVHFSVGEKDKDNMRRTTWRPGQHSAVHGMCVGGAAGVQHSACSTCFSVSPRWTGKNASPSWRLP
jgi:hypothetical protein